MDDYFKKITKYYTPAEPIEKEELFVGREKEQSLLYKSLISKGRHPIIYGVRGVGKTSLLNVTCKHFCYNNNFIAIKHICGHADTFISIFNTFLRLSFSNKKEEKFIEKSSNDFSGGFDFRLLKTDMKDSSSTECNYINLTETSVTPSLVSEIYQFQKYILIIDEFDLINNENDKILIAETIKALSDRNSETKIILSGVGNSLSDLVTVHNSTIRNLISIEVPRMTDSELSQIIETGIINLGIEFEENVKNNIVWLSDGLPYFTHLISECLADYAFFHNKKKLLLNDLKSIASNVINTMALKEIVEYNYKRAYKNTFSVFSSPLDELDDRTSYSPLTKLTVLNLYSKVNPLDNECYEKLFTEYSSLQPKHALDFIECGDLHHILAEIAKKSEILQFSNGKYFFKDAFHKTYTRIKNVYIDSNPFEDGD